MPSRPDPLPDELTDEIISHIPTLYRHHLEAYPTLLSCCLVCWQWLRAARRQLFQVVHLRSPRHYNLFVSQVLLGPDPVVVRSQLSVVRTIALQVILPRTLPLGGLLHGNNNPGPPPSSPNTFTHTFNGLLPRLTSLSLGDGSLKAYFSNDPSAVVALSQFTSIRELHIHNEVISTFEALQHTLASMPALTTLSMRGGISWPNTAPGTSPLPTHGTLGAAGPSLVDLTIDWQCNDSDDCLRAAKFVNWLASTPTTRSLRTLSVSYHQTRIIAHHGYAYVNVFGPSILRLGPFVETLERNLHGDHHRQSILF